VQENIISDDDLPKSDVELVFGLGPPLPICKMTKADEGELLLNLKRALELRIRGRVDLHSIIMNKRTFIVYSFIFVSLDQIFCLSLYLLTCGILPKFEFNVLQGPKFDLVLLALKEKWKHSGM
jgi:hypothetical protein